MRRMAQVLGAVTALGALCSAQHAAACGGCFHAEASTETTTVIGHRMVFSVNETRTVLWDQIQYTGSPDDFSWVLPIQPGAYIEASTDAWFEALDAVTATRVTAGQLDCVSGGFSENGCGCGSMNDSGGGAAGPTSGGPRNAENVEVVHEGTVGPYETVTLSSTDPNALTNWLTGRGYLVPQDIRPVIDAYVSEGFDFIALRLSPGQGVQQMTPVRVVTPGGPSELPLRMVAAGVGSFVGITLFVIGEDRYAMPDLPEVSVRTDQLAWDWLTQSSNYSGLRDRALAENTGRSYLTAFALATPFDRQITTPDGFGTTSYQVGDTNSYTSLQDVYFAQVDENARRVHTLCPAPTRQPHLVVESCAGPCESGTMEASAFVCDEADDLAAALIGMVPSSVWLTRLEMNLPVTALDADCVLEPAVNRAEIDHWRVAEKHENPPCAQPVLTPSGIPMAPGLFVFGSVLGLVARRGTRRDRR